MHSTSLRSFACLLAFSLFYSSALSRRIENHHRLHRHHHARQAPTPVSETITQVFTAGGNGPIASGDSPVPSGSVFAATDDNAVMSDMNELQDALRNLPDDLSKFVGAVQQRFKALESMIAGLLRSTLGTGPSATPVLPGESGIGVPLCRPAAGAGPLVPCQTRRSTRTNVRTSFQTITIQAPYTFPNATSSTYPGTAARSSPGPAPTTYTSVIYHTITVGVSPAPAPSPSPSSSPSAYLFNADAPNNVAVYYGQTPNTQAGGLSTLCQDVNVDIAILAFVTDFFGPNGLPSASFGSGCIGPNQVQAVTAPGLADCNTLASEIAQCQAIGKKVLLSLGGYIANSSFTSDAQAQEFAETLWNLFGAGTGDNPNIRPFGPDVVVDGFDIDNENHDTSYYGTFANALRQQFAQDDSKTYYLSAAPQCPLPDESIPMDVMNVADFVWVQFYNNPQCNLDSGGFLPSYLDWSQTLRSQSTTPGRPRLYIGAGAFPGAGTGYVAGSGLSPVVSEIREYNLPDFGGIMLWDGSEGLANVDQYGVNYIEYAKSALEL